VSGVLVGMSPTSIVKVNAPVPTVVLALYVLTVVVATAMVTVVLVAYGVVQSASYNVPVTVVKARAGVTETAQKNANPIAMNKGSFGSMKVFLKGLRISFIIVYRYSKVYKRRDPKMLKMKTLCV